MSLYIHINTGQPTSDDCLHTFKATCSICLRTANLTPTYYGVHCDTCNKTACDNLAVRLRQQRDLLGLTRRELAAALGYAPRTIADYETNWPSSKYWQRMQQYVAVQNGTGTP